MSACATPGAACRPRHRTGRAQAAAARDPQRRDAHRAQARVDQDAREDGAGVHGAALAREGRGSAHRLPGGGLPQHLRVLGGPRGDVPHRRLAVHPAVRLLPDRHRQARGLRHGRASSGGRERRADAPALRHRHRRRARRPARRRRVAARRDGAPHPRREPEHRRRDPRHRLQRRPGPARRGVRLAPRGLRPQRRDRAPHLQADPARVPLRPVARRADDGARGGSHHEVEPHPRHGRGAARRSCRRCRTCTTPAPTSSRSRSTCGPHPGTCRSIAG